MFVVVLLIAMSVMPVAAVAADARAYFAQVGAAENTAAHEEDNCTRQKSWRAIAQMEGVDSSVVNCERTRSSTIQPDSFTGRLRKGAGYEDRLEPVAASAILWPLGLPELRFTDRFTLIFLGLGIIIILGLALWTTMRGLFGFGVAVEAIEYPRLPMKISKDKCELEKDLPPRFLVIRAGENEIQALKKDAVEIDLSLEISSGRKLLLLPKGKADDPKLVLITNLGPLLGDPEGRREALKRLEWILAQQGEPPDYRIAMLTTLTPLERLLQSFERERDEYDQLDNEQQSTARLERAKYREDMRWSAVFEEFSTYYHAARPRDPQDKLKGRRPAVRQIWKELEYVPDQVIAAMIWDPGPPVLDDEILDWAEKITDNSDPEPQAIVDYLASNLIEHYHLMWSLSSREERLLLYRIAHGHVPNIARAYALRSLVKRGLVVLDPHPRTMNESFAQFVQHVEKPQTITRWRRTQEKGYWGAAQLLLGLPLALALGVLILAVIRNRDSVAAIIPLIVATVPALIHAVTSAKRTAVA